MSRLRISHHEKTIRAPRVSGDEPLQVIRRAQGLECSPRERMSPMRKQPRIFRPRAPRVSGDEPGEDAAAEMMIACSPRGRG